MATGNNNHCKVNTRPYSTQVPVEWKYLRQHPICQILVVFLWITRHVFTNEAKVQVGEGTTHGGRRAPGTQGYFLGLRKRVLDVPEAKNASIRAPSVMQPVIQVTELTALSCTLSRSPLYMRSVPGICHIPNSEFKYAIVIPAVYI
ncbi:hypothetical protein PIIN_10581 [Serendipita indica DSM 11827]|uniref:Uncharacterized protein n=1 Tax=Serendipita indica (strain DSM 11827) TaxID=1109443 RepID=G4TZ47_SERID|nr:hypothetical protein PIIN_10581 [Serendipita indica DSM 11827]